MKKLYFVVIIILMIFFTNISYGEVNINLENELEEQKADFKITDFLYEAKRYSPDFINDLGIDNLFNMASKGKVNNKLLFSKFFELISEQMTFGLKILAGILTVVLLHSILNSLTEGLEQNEVSKIVFYVQYILIVSIIMVNFSEILNSVNQTIENLVNFSYSLIPLLISLILYTGSISTGSVIEPVMLFLIQFIAKLLKTLILPGISIITVLIIICKISEKVQITKISKFMKSGVVWFLGVILTVFVGVLSIEGNLTASVDGITAKTAKAAVSNLIPVVRESFRRWY